MGNATAQIGALDLAVFEGWSVEDGDRESGGTEGRKGSNRGKGRIVENEEVRGGEGCLAI